MATLPIKTGKWVKATKVKVSKSGRIQLMVPGSSLKKSAKSNPYMVLDGGRSMGPFTTKSAAKMFAAGSGKVVKIRSYKSKSKASRRRRR